MVERRAPRPAGGARFGSVVGVNAIIFDVDGTLIDTYRLYMESYRRVLSPILGYSPDDDEILGRGAQSERSILRAWVEETELQRCHDALCRHYAELHRTLAEGFYDGVPEMLRALRLASVPLGVVTSKGRAAWEVTLRHLALGEFPVVITEDDVREPKPHPEGLLRAARELGVGPSGAVYIGDSRGDLEAGRAAGMRVGAALWPKTAPGEREAFLEAIGPLQPEWLFDRPADVTREFAGWC
jgi:pyrophosphatase PpaX